jgi:Phage P22-like portal protein
VSEFEDDPSGTPEEKALRLALDRFKLSSEAESAQREAELDDLEFVDHEQQWPSDLEESRGPQKLPDGTVIAARPCLVISKLVQPLQQMANQRRQARLQLQFAPKGDGASQEIAEVYEDLARAIQVDSRADVARNWAADRADKCGRGFYRILTAYANDGDDDLDIIYKRIPNQFAVYLDPFAQEPDWSDGEFAFITEDVPLRRFRREYGTSQLAGLRDDDLRGIGDQFPDWIKVADLSAATIRVAEYFTVQMDAKGKHLGVTWHKMTCKEFVEQQPWDGRYIPIVPVVGIETNVNGQRRWKGLVRPAKDAQRSYNYMRSASVQAIGLAPTAPWIVEEGSIAGYEPQWKQSNVRNWPFLVYKRTNLNGGPADKPYRDVAEPAIQAMTLAAHEAAADVQSVTGFHAPALGEAERDRSGKAIQALQRQAEIGASGYLDNLVSISMAYEGKVLRDLIPKIYNRPGRILATIGAADERKAVMIGVPYRMQGSTPQPADGMTPDAKPPIDLSKGEYTVQPTVGKAHSTRREEAVAMVGEVLQAAPQLTPMLADILVDNMDIPGGKQMADRLKKMLPPQLQEDANGQNPEMQLMQLKQQMAQLGQLYDLTVKELNEKTRIQETDTIKANQELTRTHMELESKERIEYAKIQSQIEIEQLKAGNAAALAQMQAQIDYLIAQQGAGAAMQQQAAAQAHQAAMAGAQAMVDQGEAQAGREHEVGMTGMQQGHEADMTAQQQAFDAQQAAQQPQGTGA